MGTKINTGRFFEHFVLGETIQHATPRTITAGDTALYIALTGTRNPLHCSDPLAQSLGYAQAPVDDLLAFHIAFGKTVPDISVNAVANLGYAEVRFLQPVYVGDTLTTSSEVIGLKQNSNGKNGVVWVRSTTLNQHQQPVLSWVRWVMVHKKNHEAPAPETVIPALAEHVKVESLVIPAHLKVNSALSHATGGHFWWDDYQVEECLRHPAGLTIHESDHTMATHLYQNNARLHFDAHLMKSTPQGQCLVYGGVVISACRAISFEGLENAIAILAINGGTHANPCYAGDTIYCLTKVLDKWALPDPALGALRLRMVGVKNISPANLENIKTTQGYHPHVVLDLDYTVLMPRKGNS